MPEIRKDPFNRFWVIMAHERSKRPLDFKRHKTKTSRTNCPFCEGNETQTPPEVLVHRQTSSQENEPGWSVRVFANKFPALIPEGVPEKIKYLSYETINGIGYNEVLVEDPDHEAKLTTISETKFNEIIKAYIERMRKIEKDNRIKYVLVFKNFGGESGASLEHSHGQIVGVPVLPRFQEDFLKSSSSYFKRNKKCLMCQILNDECSEKVRVIDENTDFVVLAPYASRFSFQTWIVPKKHCPFFEDLSGSKIKNLSKIFQPLLKRQEESLNDPAYNFMIHTAPVGLKNRKEFHWFIEMEPITAKMAGFEMGTGYHINSVLPEHAARILRST